ncbi:MAG TPA: FtsX-like permease family protein [Gammaproteobacteria bacterium]
MNMLLLASRNLFRNTRRSFITIAAIAAGYAAVILFGGYISDVYNSLKVQAVSGERLGHLTIYKEGMLNEGRLKPRKYLLSPAESATLETVVRDYPGVRLVSPRLPISGMLNHGSASTIFIGEGMVAEDIPVLRGELEEGYGGWLDAGKPAGIAMSSEMARLLDLGIDDEPILITSTFAGQANAMDARIIDIFETGNAGTNDKTLLVPFEYAQNLMDTAGVERYVVLLDDIGRTVQAREDLTRRLEQAGLAVEIKTWKELSSFYNQVKSLFDMIFTFIFSIVFVVIIMSVINTMSMTVIERTREIGTLRALGLRRSGIVSLFTTEGALLALVGVSFGLTVSLLVAWLVDVAHITYTPPNSSSAVPLLVEINAAQMLTVSLLATVLAALSSAWPALGAARKEIHTALTHV